MNNLKGTETEKNLLKAFVGESQARMRYDFFSKQAKKEGFEQISAFFAETALNEKEHAKRFFKYLDGEMLAITSTYPVGKIGNTIENLQTAAQGEHEEWSILYPQFGEIALKEGFHDIAECFAMIATVEQAHENRYKKLSQNIRKGKVFAREEITKRKCTNCGYLHFAKEAPEKCPACLHLQAYFQIKEENY